MSPGPLALLLVAHGTAYLEGRAAVAELAAEVAAQRPGVRVHLAWLDHGQPTVEATLRALPGEVVVVPLLLAGGYHATLDIARRAAAAGPRAHPVLVAGPLGDHPGIAELLDARLAQAEAPAEAALVLATAGSASPGAAGTTTAVAGRLAALRGGVPVLPAFPTTGHRPTVREAYGSLTATGRPVAVATNLLAPGRLSAAVVPTAPWVSRPLAPHPLLASVVLYRFDEVRTGAADPTAGPGLAAAGRAT